MKSYTDPQAALAAIEALDKFGINLGLKRVLAAMKALGNPQQKYPVIHIGGTNGKGSTCAMVAKALELAGYRTGLYTSPPLESFGERIRVNGALMPDNEVPGILDEVLAAPGVEPDAEGMTQFEIITAMAFVYFARQEVDVAIIEVGLGGRLDSTNVLTPEVTAITNIGLDHSEHLGATIREIASEKAGIAKEGVTMCTTAEGEALEVVREACKKLGAPLKALGETFTYSEDNGNVKFISDSWVVEEIELALPGGFQLKNLSLAAAILETLADKGWRTTPKILVQAASEVRWPGRMETFGDGPRLLVDGAHNPHAAAALVESLEGIRERCRGDIHIVLGVLGDKDAASMVQMLAPLSDKLTLTRSSSVRSFSPDELAEAASEVEFALTNPDVATALSEAWKEAKRDDLIVATGSLTVVAEARAWLREEGLAT